MRLRPRSWARRSSAPAVPIPALGYPFSAGGLSNQKLGLFGLFAAAAAGEAGGRLRLPDLFVFDQARPTEGTRRPLGEVFFPDMLAAFALRHGVEIVAEEGPRETPWWDCFVSGSNLVAAARAEGRQSPADLASDFFRSLVPRLRGTALFTDLHIAAFEARRVGAVVQLRIEADWREHATGVLVPYHGAEEEHAGTASAILAKVRASLPGTGPALYVVSDERHLPAPKEKIRATILGELGFELVWKSDLVAAERLEALTPLDLSLLDFEMAVSAEVFVGNTRSTFANLATFERYSRTLAGVTGHYACNAPGPQLRRRTDNGAFCVAADATAGG